MDVQHEQCINKQYFENTADHKNIIQGSLDAIFWITKLKIAPTDESEPIPCLYVLYRALVCGKDWTRL